MQSTSDKYTKNNEEFWADYGETLSWYKKWDKILDISNPPFVKWYAGGIMNLCYNALDRHVEGGKSEKQALISYSPIEDKTTIFTYFQILKEVSKLGNVLLELGVKKGDVVFVALPKIPEAIITILACIRIGAVFCCTCGGLSLKDTVQRIQICKPKIIVTTDVGIIFGQYINFAKEIEEALKVSSEKPKLILIERNPENKHTSTSAKENDSYDWNDLMSRNATSFCTRMEVNEPCVITFTSGSTGTPKPLLHSCNIHASVETIRRFWVEDSVSETVILSTTPIAFFAGLKWNLLVPFLKGKTVVIFEGDTSGLAYTETMMRLISDYRVTALQICPKDIRQFRKSDPESKLNLKYTTKSLNCVLSLGEKTHDNYMNWMLNYFGCNIFSGYGSTEGGAVCSNGKKTDFQNGKLANSADLFFIQTGSNVKLFVIDEKREAEPGETGRILLKLPIRPEASTTMYGNDKSFIEEFYSSFPGFFDTKDDGYILNGKLTVVGRGNDGIRLTTQWILPSAIENVVLSHPDVNSASVVSMPHHTFRNVPILFYILNKDCRGSHILISEEIKKLVNKDVEIHLDLAVPIEEFPETASGKIARRVLISLLSGGEEEMNLNGIINADCISKLKEIIKSLRIHDRYAVRSD